MFTSEIKDGAKCPKSLFYVVNNKDEIFFSILKRIKFSKIPLFTPQHKFASYLNKETVIDAKILLLCYLQLEK